jgi:hypothetical protein
VSPDGIIIPRDPPKIDAPGGKPPATTVVVAAPVAPISVRAAKPKEPPQEDFFRISPISQKLPPSVVVAKTVAAAPPLAPAPFPIVPSSGQEIRRYRERLYRIEKERDVLAQEKSELQKLKEVQDQKRVQAEASEKELLEVCAMLKKKLKLADDDPTSRGPATSTPDALVKELKKLVFTIPEPVPLPAPPSPPPIASPKELVAVPDTNCFLRFMPEICSLRNAASVLVRVPMVVVRELDALKSNKDVQWAARGASNILFGFIREPQTNFAVQGFHEMAQLVGEAAPTNNDEKILQACLYYARTHRVHLLSEDTNLKLKAVANRISCSGAAEFAQRITGTLPSFSVGRAPPPPPPPAPPTTASSSSYITQHRRQHHRRGHQHRRRHSPSAVALPPPPVSVSQPSRPFVFAPPMLELLPPSIQPKSAWW